MVLYVNQLLFTVFFVVFMFETALGLNCYQCTGTDSNSPFQCNEFLDDTDLQPDSCGQVYGAEYCIKHVGRFEVVAMNCYQCTSNTTIDCGDGMIHMGGISPHNCDHVFEAQYCIKQTGGIGTKRYCSSHDLGNYCDYVKQPGDTLEYRSCVYTCRGDGCNSSAFIQPSLSFISFLYFLHYFIIL